jgi:hypothetical protein
MAPYLSCNLLVCQMRNWARHSQRLFWLLHGLRLWPEVWCAHLRHSEQ